MSHIGEEFSKIEDAHAWNTIFNKLANDHRVRTLEKKCDTAVSNINRGLNRFRDVLPYDDTRVHLGRGSNKYINANYVEVPDANRKYILTQGPLQTTSGHFWQMVWEQNARVIVMLTRLFEKGSPKCWQYYPDSQGQSAITYDDVDFRVCFVSDRQHRYYTQRNMQLVNLLTGESRLIIHWSDFDWPDHGAPKSPEPFLKLLSDVRRCGAFDPCYGPPILHCSAGIGRSGTFVLVDSILKMLAHVQNPVDVSLIEVLSHIRMQRCGLIQTPEQLRFSYIAIVAGFNILDQLEQHEQHSTNVNFCLSNESDNDDDNELDHTCAMYSKVCRRQDNIMPNSRLSETLEDINCDLMRRVDSSASNYQPSPQTVRRLTSVSALKNSLEDLKQFSPVSPMSPSTLSHDTDTSLRLRQERLSRNESIEKKVLEIKTKLRQQSSSQLSANSQVSLFKVLPTSYCRPLFVGIFTLFTGSLILYKYVSSNESSR